VLQKSSFNICKITVLIGLILSNLTFINLIYAETSTATTVGQFLGIEIGARSIALGNASTASVNDTTATYWNPAALSFLTDAGFSINHITQGEYLNYEYFAGAIPFSFGSLGISIGYLHQPDIEEISLGNPTGNTYKIYDLLTGLSFGKSITNYFSFGLTTKYIRSVLIDYAANGVAIDIGALLKLKLLKFYQSKEDNVKIGVCVQNIGTKMSYVSEKYPLPLYIRGGIYYRPVKLANLNFDISKGNDTYMTYSVGTEFLPDSFFNPRIGYEHSKGANRFSGGLGAHLKIKATKLDLDYAFTLQTLSGIGHIISLNYSFPINISQKVKGQKEYIDIEKVEKEPIFSALYKYYSKVPLGRLTIKNISSKKIKNIYATFSVKRYIDFPTESTSITSLSPGEEANLNLYGTFNNKILTLTEDTPISGEIKIYYLVDDTKQVITKQVSFKMLNRNALTWDDDKKLASFITPKDTPVKDFSRNVTLIIDEISNQYIFANDNLKNAIAIFNTMGVYGIKYTRDPHTPYEVFSKKEDAVDYIQYPRDVINYKSGDCDDLVALYSALLESIGIETAFITLPGHIFMMFNTDIPIEKWNDVAEYKDLIINRKETVWVPVEVTLCGKTFLEAWSKGAEEYNHWNNKENLINIIDTRIAWSKYVPATFEEREWHMESTLKSKILSAFSYEMEKYLERIISVKTVELKNELAKDPNNQEIYNSLGIIYGKNGLFKQAISFFTKSIELNKDNYAAYNNMGNVFFLMHKYDEALEAYKKAYKIEPSNSKIILNIAKTQYHLRNFYYAEQNYKIAAKIDSTFASEYNYLTEGNTNYQRNNNIRELNLKPIWIE